MGDWWSAWSARAPNRPRSAPELPKAVSLQGQVEHQRLSETDDVLRQRCACDSFWCVDCTIADTRVQGLRRAEINRATA